MDDAIINILERLKPFPIGTKQDISDLLNEMMPMDQSLQAYEFQQKSGDVIRFVDQLKNSGYLDFDAASIQLPDYRNNPTQWFIQFRAALTTAGAGELKNEETRKADALVNSSAVETNRSIIETNVSVKKTNEAMVLSLSDQSLINSANVENAKKQTDILSSQVEILSKQTMVLIATAAIGIASLIISGISLYESIRESTLQKQIQEQSKEIKYIRIQLLKARNENGSLRRMLQAKQVDEKKK